MADLYHLGRAPMRRWASRACALLLVVGLCLALPAGTSVWAYDIESDQETDRPVVTVEGGDRTNARAYTPATDEPSALTISVPYGSESDRFGYNVIHQITTVEDFDVSPLHAGWYLDYRVRMDPPRAAGLEFVQLVWTEEDIFWPDAATLTAIAQANPGSLWLIGNEPDSTFHGNSTPAQYVQHYHEIYHILKAADPTAQVANGGIVQATPVRLMWLQEVWDGYQALYGETMPVDVWNIHNFVLNEHPTLPDDPPDNPWWYGAGMPPGITDTSQAAVRNFYEMDQMAPFEEQIVRFRQWMADHGQRDKPLIVSEYGLLVVENDGYSVGRVTTYMLATFDYFSTATDPLIGYPADGNRLVQRWSWFALTSYYPSQPYRLYDRDNSVFTALGDAWAAYVTPLWTPYVDPAPARLTSANVDGQPTLVSLDAMVRNKGNTDVSDVRVQFWVGDETHPVGAEQVIPSLPGRALETVSVHWEPPACGTYTVGVTVDKDDLIVEHDETNNLLSSAIEVALPVCVESQVVPAGDAPPIEFAAASLTLDCSSGPGGTVEIARHNTNYPSPPAGVGTMNGYWEISSDFAGAFSCDLIFHYNEADLNVAAEGDIAGAARWDAADVMWEYVGGTVDAGADTVTLHDVTSFSPWLLLTSTPPVATTDLAGTRAGGDLQLAWPAVTQNIVGGAMAPDHYVIYRRVDEPYFIPSPADVIATPATPSFTDSGVLGDPAHNYFYVVTAVDALGTESAPSNRLGAFDFGLTPAAALGERAYNLIAANLDLLAVTDADELAAYAQAATGGHGVYMVLRHDAPAQAIEWRLPGQAGTNFAVTAGDAVYLTLDETGPTNVSLVGSVPSIGDVSFALTRPAPGGSCTYTFISVPLHRDDLIDADTLAADIGGVFNLARYNAATQDLTWRVPGVSGDNFPVRAGYPYIVCLDDTAPPVWP